MQNMTNCILGCENPGTKSYNACVNLCTNWFRSNLRFCDSDYDADMDWCAVKYWACRAYRGY
jgi:hypothetical protein